MSKGSKKDNSELDRNSRIQSDIKELQECFVDIGEVIEGETFNEFTLRIKSGAAKIIDGMLKKDIIAGIPASLFYKNMEDILIIAVTEKRTENEILRFAEEIKKAI